MTPRNKIIESIEKFVGEDKELWQPKSFPKGKEGVLDNETAKIAIDNIIYAQDNRFEIGYNQAKAEFRSKVPQLADEILEVVVGEIKEYAEPYDNAKWLNDINPKRILNSLTQDINSNNK